jgi:hypothetical protein
MTGTSRKKVTLQTLARKAKNNRIASRIDRSPSQASGPDPTRTGSSTSRATSSAVRRFQLLQGARSSEICGKTCLMPTPPSSTRPIRAVPEVGEFLSHEWRRAGQVLESDGAASSAGRLIRSGPADADPIPRLESRLLAALHNAASQFGTYRHQ